MLDEIINGLSGSDDSSVLPLSVLNALPNPIFVLSRDGRFLLANAAAESFFHSSETTLKKRSFDWYLPSGSPVRGVIEQAVEAGAPVSEYRIDISSPKLGPDRWVDVYVSPIVEQPGRVAVMLQVRSMADTLDRQLTHRSAARTVTGLAAMLAHEIKNPLSGIRGAAQLLEAGGSDEDRSLTRLITEEADRIVRLVDRMEVFSDERPIERDPINIHSVLEQVKGVARNGFAHDVVIEEHYDPSLPPVLGNRDQLVQIMLNLVKNACEAMDQTHEPVLRLTTAYRPGMRVAARGSDHRISLPIALTVSDNGSGVPADIQSYMFDPFITTKTNGSGLGLALVAKIVGDHGGVISCDSQPGDTTFTILLPMWDEVSGRKGRNDG